MSSNALSASIFRRSGHKKELFNDASAQGQPAGAGQPSEEEPELVQELENLIQVLRAPKAG